MHFPADRWRWESCTLLVARAILFLFAVVTVQTSAFLFCCSAQRPFPELLCKGGGGYVKSQQQNADESLFFLVKEDI
jgi:hypothetical protein